MVPDDVLARLLVAAEENEVCPKAVPMTEDTAEICCMTCGYDLCVVCRVKHAAKNASIWCFSCLRHEVLDEVLAVLAEHEAKTIETGEGK